MQRLRPDDHVLGVRDAVPEQRLPRQVLHVRQMPPAAGARRPLQPGQRQPPLRAGLHQNAQGDGQPRGRGAEDEDEGQLGHQGLKKASPHTKMPLVNIPTYAQPSSSPILLLC